MFLVAKVNTDNLSPHMHDRLSLRSSALQRSVKMLVPASELQMAAGISLTLAENQKVNSWTLFWSHEVLRGKRSGRRMGQQNSLIWHGRPSQNNQLCYSNRDHHCSLTLAAGIFSLAGSSGQRESFYLLLSSVWTKISQQLFDNLSETFFFFSFPARYDAIRIIPHLIIIVTPLIYP